MTGISLPRRVSTSEQVLFQEIDGECVLLDMVSEQYFGLDDVGTRIWNLLTEHGDAEEVLMQLQQVYDVDAARLREDLASLIEQLRDKGLVSVEV